MLKIHTLNDRICPHFNNAAHGVEVPPGARLLFTNGQVGARKDGMVPESISDQSKSSSSGLRISSLRRTWPFPTW